jgi:agmatine deiminase
VRFVNDSTLLLAWVDENEKDHNPINRINYERMSANLRILEDSRDQNGKSFHIIRVPLPDLMFKNVVITHFQRNESDDAILSDWLSPQSGFKAGDTVQRVAAASYLNYFVTNGVVLAPTYKRFGSSPVKEDKVHKILQEVFPGRRIIFIDVMNLNYEGGGIHCITQQQPARE